MQDVTLEIVRGDSFTKTLGPWTGSGSDPIDLTNYSARLQVRTRMDRCESEFELTDGDGLTLSDLGTIAIAMTPEQTEKINLRSSVWDLELTSPTDVVTTAYGGKISVTLDVTR